MALKQTCVHERGNLGPTIIPAKSWCYPCDGTQNKPPQSRLIRDNAWGRPTKLTMKLVNDLIDDYNTHEVSCAPGLCSTCDARRIKNRTAPEPPATFFVEFEPPATFFVEFEPEAPPYLMPQTLFGFPVVVIIDKQPYELVKGEDLQLLKQARELKRLGQEETRWSKEMDTQDKIEKDARRARNLALDNLHTAQNKVKDVANDIKSGAKLKEPLDRAIEQGLGRIRRGRRPGDFFSFGNW